MKLYGDSQGKDLNTAADIGTGPVAVMASLFPETVQVFGTEIDCKSFEHAQKHLGKKGNVTLVKVDDSADILHTLMRACAEKIDLIVCNPPYFDIHQRGTKTQVMTDSEGFYPGGEIGFCRELFNQSLLYKDRIRIVTCLLGRKQSVSVMKRFIGDHKMQVVSACFCPNQTRTWAVAWSFSSKLAVRAGISQMKPIYMETDCPLKVIEYLRSIDDGVVVEPRLFESTETKYTVTLPNTWSRRQTTDELKFTVNVKPWGRSHRVYFDLHDPNGQDHRDKLCGLVSKIKKTILL